MLLIHPTEGRDTHLPVLGHGVPHPDLASPTEGGQLTADEEQVVDDHRHLELAWRSEREHSDVICGTDKWQVDSLINYAQVNIK